MRGHTPRPAFTLLELLVCLVILGILWAISVPAPGAISPRQRIVICQDHQRALQDWLRERPVAAGRRLPDAARQVLKPHGRKQLRGCLSRPDDAFAYEISTGGEVSCPVHGTLRRPLQPFLERFDSPAPVLLGMGGIVVLVWFVLNHRRLAVSAWLPGDVGKRT